MALEHLLSVHELTATEVQELVTLGREMKADPARYRQALAGKSLAMIFMKSSTRTRVSFEVGITQLGGQGLFLSSRDIQLNRGEPISDTAAVLSRYVDGIMARTFAHDDVLNLAKYGTVPVINGLTDLLHPCQALADLMTVEEHFGDLAGRTLVYVGDGNNVAHSLMFAAAKAGMGFRCVAPDGYFMDPEMMALGRADAEAAGTELIQTSDLAGVDGADVVYTDVWASMGQEDLQQVRLRDFQGYQVDDALMARAGQDAIFMHCLPAHRGEEVSASVADGKQSVIFDQAENRLHVQKAIMQRLMAS